jgi:hypothetical protein
MSIHESMNYPQYKFNPQFEPQQRDSQLLWRAHWGRFSEMGFTQIEALQKLRRKLVAAGYLQEDRREMG